MTNVGMDSICDMIDHKRVVTHTRCFIVHEDTLQIHSFCLLIKYNKSKRMSKQGMPNSERVFLVFSNFYFCILISRELIQRIELILWVGNDTNKTI